MTYQATESGPLGRPVDLYEFAIGATFYRVTSAATTQTGVGGTTYEPLEGLTHSEPTQRNDEQSGEITISCPSNFEVAKIFRETIPSVLPTLTIFQKHLNDGDGEIVTKWKGEITSSSGSDGRKATLRGLPATRLLGRTFPRVVYSGLCNHQLFDNGCGVDRANFTFAGFINGIDSKGTTLTINGLRAGALAIQTAQGTSLTAQELDDYFQRGYIRLGTVGAQYRMIVETDIGGAADVVRITFPFRGAEVGDGIDVFAGCNHSLDASAGHCERKFSNGVNFGGFPYVPGTANNPFTRELDSGRGDGSSGPRRTRGGFF